MQDISRRQFMVSTAAIGATTTIGMSSGSVFAAPLSFDKYPIPKSQANTFIEFTSVVTPDSDLTTWSFGWEIAEDPYFENVVQKDSVKYIDYTDSDDVQMTVRLEHVPPGKKLYYRTICDNCYAQEQVLEQSHLESRLFTVFPTQEISKAVADSTISPVVEQSF